MITFYKTMDDKLTKVDALTDGVWVNIINPTQEEVDKVIGWGIPVEFITNPLDIDELSYTERDEGFTFILVRLPYNQGREEGIPCIAIPLGIIIANNYIVTVCRFENDLIKNILSKNTKYFSTEKRARFVLQIMLAIASLFLNSLRSINKTIEKVEDELQQSIRNKEVLDLLKYQKSLVYLSTALKSNELMFERLQRTKIFVAYPDDAELLEDVIIENLQAIEMTNIAGNLLIQMMDAFASIIQNNQNIIFKIMTAVTIILSLPAIISSFYGMNVDLPIQQSSNFFWVLVMASFVVMMFVAIFFKRIDWL